MISLISLLKEIEIKPPGQIKLKDLEYDDDIDSSYPVAYRNDNNLIRKVIGEKEFYWWKYDMIHTYGSNLILLKLPNSNKKYWVHGKYKLEVTKTSNPENQKYWNY